MSARRAGCYHHPVESVFLNLLGDALLGILRAGVQIVFSIDHTRQRAGFFDHLGDIYYRSDVDATVTNKHSNARRFVGDIPLRRIFRSPR